MATRPIQPDAKALETMARTLWQSRGLPRDSGEVGPESGPRVRQFLPFPVGGETLTQQWAHLLVADVDARYLALRGARTRTEISEPTAASLAIPATEQRARGLWVGRGEAPAPSPTESRDRAREMVERLVASQLIVARDAPMRVCPQCQLPRTPEGILYNSESGPAYLVRFPIVGSNPRTSLLVWTDAVWKLLGASAVLVNPSSPYSVIRYRRRDTDERVIIAESAVPRLTEWLPGSELEVVESGLGEDLVDTVYEHPLATEYPALSALPGPAGTVLPSTEVTESGTGLVLLAPAHGATDAMIAKTLRVPGPTVVSTTSMKVVAGPPKYSDLSVAVAESFVLHDLTESGLLFAELRVQRGVPHCTTCGAEIIWAPARTWCLEPGRMSDPTATLFGQLLPGEPLPRSAETVPWPIAELTTTSDASAPEFWECPVCERLGLPEESASCSCGQPRQRVRRPLLAAFRAPIDLWARTAPVPEGDALRFYVSERRRVPMVIHQLMALEAARVRPAQARLVPIASIPAQPEVPDPGPQESIDAWRVALVRAAESNLSGYALGLVRAQEGRRLERWVRLVDDFIRAKAEVGYDREPGTITAYTSELLEEDRALLSRFERLRLDVVRLFDAGNFSRGYERLVRFTESELMDDYFGLLQRRREETTLSPGVLSMYRTIDHVLERWLELISPLIPFTAEALVHRLSTRSTSLFERGLFPVLEPLLDPELERRYFQWRSIARAVESSRRTLGRPKDSPLPRLVVLTDQDRVANDVRQSVDVIRRVTGTEVLEVGSPSEPWVGRQLAARSVVTEIQRAYPGRETRLVRMLEQLPARRLQEGLAAGTLRIVLDGQTIPIGPGMVEFIEQLPDDLYPMPWRSGEVLVGFAGRSGSAGLPIVSLEVARLVRRMARDLKRVSGQVAFAPEVVISAEPPVLDELRQNSEKISLLLNVDAVRLAAQPTEFVPGESRKGRTSEGRRWSYWIPGFALPRRRRKDRERQGGLSRIVLSTEVAAGGGSEIDYASEEFQARDSAVHAMVESVDSTLGAPLLGPTKAAYAWEAGFHNADALLAASYEDLESVTGFGPWLAGSIVRHRGEQPPRRVLSLGPVTEGTFPVPPTEVDVSASQIELGMSAPSESPSPVELASELPRELIDSEALRSVGLGPEIALPEDPLHEGSPSPPPARPAMDEGPLGGAPSIASAVLTPPGAPRSDLGSGAPAPVRPEGGLQLAIGDSQEGAWRRFMDATSAGHRGLCLSRELPERMRAFLGPRDVEVYWVSNLGRSDSVSPGNIEQLRSLFRKAIEERQVRAVYLEGVEYLVMVQSVDRALDWLTELDALARDREVRVWVPVNPQLVRESVLARLEQSLPRSAAA
ncbi:MAG: DUF835 domain-containing protein [Thermoplasmata archaeon]